LQGFIENLVGHHTEERATRLVRESLTTIERGDSHVVHLASSNTKRKLYEHYCYQRGWVPGRTADGSHGRVHSYEPRENDEEEWPIGSVSLPVCSWWSFHSFWKKEYPNLRIRPQSEDKEAAKQLKAQEKTRAAEEKAKKAAAKKDEREKKAAATSVSAAAVASALDNRKISHLSEENVEASVLDNRAQEEDWPILLDEVRVCCCGDNCKNQSEEEEPEYFCHTCCKYSHYMCSSLINGVCTCNQCALGI
jgi:hypothetical protein